MLNPLPSLLDDRVTLCVAILGAMSFPQQGKSGMFLDEELLMCHNAQDETPYVTQDVEEAYYCVPTIEDGQWDDLSNRMGLVESSVGQEGPLMADPCLEEQMMSNNEKINDVGMSDWLEFQEKAKLHNNQMKELVTSHVQATMV